MPKLKENSSEWQIQYYFAVQLAVGHMESSRACVGKFPCGCDWSRECRSLLLAILGDYWTPNLDF